MKLRQLLSRALEALLLAALGGGVSYGLVAWLAPEGVSAAVVAAMVAAIAGVIALAPGASSGAGSDGIGRLGAEDGARMDINPGSGLPMSGSIDAAGNPIGYNSPIIGSNDD